METGHFEIKVSLEVILLNDRAHKLRQTAPLVRHHILTVKTPNPIECFCYYNITHTPLLLTEYIIGTFSESLRLLNILRLASLTKIQSKHGDYTKKHIKHPPS